MFFPVLQSAMNFVRKSIHFLFSNMVESPVIVQRESFSETEFYYIQLFAKQKQLTIDWINDQTLHSKINFFVKAFLLFRCSVTRLRQ